MVNFDRLISGIALITLGIGNFASSESFGSPDSSNKAYEMKIAFSDDCMVDTEDAIPEFDF